MMLGSETLLIPLITRILGYVSQEAIKIYIFRTIKASSGEKDNLYQSVFF